MFAVIPFLSYRDVFFLNLFSVSFNIAFIEFVRTAKWLNEETEGCKLKKRLRSVLVLPVV
jgi:hypothetical protein